tara:strand:- start:113 stop:712 length:600 start_codon:yes stop_codon:yes gene_type:complete
MKNLYVAIEGVDGSGKSTFLKELVNELNKKGVVFITLREPGHGVIGEKIRELLLSNEHEVSSRAEVLLFAANRAQLSNDEIKPALEAGKWVFSDRTVVSSLAYQALGRGLDIKNVQEVNEFALAGVWPNKVILLNLPVDKVKDRQVIADRIGSSDFEFFSKVQEAYITIANENKDSYLVLDAEREISQNVSTTLEWLGL